MAAGASGTSPIDPEDSTSTNSGKAGVPAGNSRMSAVRLGFTGPAALVPGELRGYRRFRLGADGLYPTVHAQCGPWAGSIQYAGCAAGFHHRAPARDCSCGLYGWYYPDDAYDSSGFGDVTAVIAARGRTILGDYGFRTASARIEAITLPARLRSRPRAAARTRQMLNARYPRTAVYRSRRQMLRDYPPHELRELGITMQSSASRRYRRLARVVWAAGVGGCFSLALFPRETLSAAGPAFWFGALVVFLLWQALLVRLVTVSLRRHTVARRR